MIRYSHAMTCLMAYYNKKGIETISIVLQTNSMTKVKPIDVHHHILACSILEYITTEITAALR